MTRRPRWTRCIALGTVVLAAGAWPVAARGMKPQPTLSPRVVTVAEGDSLWTLAREYGDPHRDVRTVVTRMLQVNDVDPGDLQPGQQVTIPADCLPPQDR